jgi:ankyrin repeat protein
MDRSDLEMNKPDKDGLTALSHTIMFSRKDMTQAMLKHRRGCHMNLDTFLASYYGRSIREAIQHTFPELMPELPEPFQEKPDSPIAAKRLLSSLQTGDFSRFQSLLKSHSVNLIHWYDEPYHCTIIEIACQLKNREGFVKELLKAGANPNTVNPITSQSLLHLTAKRGNIKLLQILLHTQGINVNVKDSYGRTPLHCLAGVHCRSKTESDFLQKSLGLLLGESDPANNTTPVADLHAVMCTGETALHIATRMGDRQTVLALLRHGANLMHKVSTIGPPLSYIDPSVMENFLDECIDSSDESSVQQDYMLTFDYNFLNPIKGSDEKQQYCVPEMPPLKYLASKYKFKHLLKHPIITSFLTLKWRKIRFMYFTNFVFYSLFLSVLTWYSFITSGDKDEDNERIGNEKKIDNESLKQTGNDSNGDRIERLVSLTVLSILLALLVLREAFQFLMSPKVYLKHHNNWLLWVIIATTLNVCLGNAVNVFPKCMALSLLLAWTQFVSFLGGFPFLSIQLEMLKTVAWTSFIFLVCYCPLFFAFGISFYIMFRNSGSNEDEFFSSSFGMSMLKVFIMFSGEFEASDIPFEVTPYTSHLVFTVFVFLISIVLLNLLNGLAVSDAQAIRNDAEILSLSSRVKLISYIEKTSSGRIQFFSVLKNLPDKKLRVFPNRKEGRVEVNGTVVQNTFLDQEIVQQAISIANNKKKMSQENENEREKQLQKELTDIEKCHLYMRKELNEIKVKLDSFDKANKETQNKLNEILTLVLKSYGSHTSHK